MKLLTILLGGIAATGLSSAALAADLIVSEPAAVPLAAPADNGLYVGVFAGGWWPSSIEATGDDQTSDDTYDFDFDGGTGWLLGAVVGGHLVDNLRGEVELSTGGIDLTHVYSDAASLDDDLDDAPATASYLLANLWYDIPVDAGFTPYLGGGVGAGYITATGDWGLGDIDLSGWGWAWQVGAGVKVDVADNIALDLGYRYKTIVDADIGSAFGADVTAGVSSHVLQVGLTIGF